MQGKLYKTVGNPQPPLRIAKCIWKSKFQNFEILLFTIFYSLFTIPIIAQPYDWEWALKGGGNLSSNIFDSDSQQIYDVKVGTDNNYYFLASINASAVNSPDPQLAGQPVKQYNRQISGFEDVFLFSTTCNGQVRWSQAIGGKQGDRAYNLALDSKNNVYVGATVTMGFDAFSQPQWFYTHFSPTDSIKANPNINSNSFEPYLVKYDSNGQYQGKKSLQDNIQNIHAGTGPIIYDLYIDSNDTIHFIAGLYYGTYLNGSITVPSQFVYTPHPFYTYKTQFHLIKCDTNLNYVSNMVLPVEDSTGFINRSTRFTYDENLNRYYVAGYRRFGTSIIPLTYNGKAFSEASYILAINGADGSEVWRREVHSQLLNNGDLPYNDITSLIVDPVTSDVYIGGKIWRSYNEQNLKIYDPHNPTTTTYTFTPTPITNLPILIKFNSSGTVQWVKTPTKFAANFTTSTDIYAKGLALRGNEIAFGSREAYFEWDGFTQNNPQFYWPEPVLLRFNKKTGQTIGFHTIKGTGSNNDGLTGVAVDNDGNYVIGGSFSGMLFSNANSNVPAIGSSGGYNFFIAKLAASVCGTAVTTDKFNKLSVNLYPNPTADIVNIQTEEALHNYEVYNVLGQLIQKGMFNDGNKIDLNGATAGTYFIKIATIQGNATTAKVVKK